MVEENLGEFTNVSVELFDGLLVEHAKQKGATVLVRGLRVISDFEYEFQMAQMNRHLDANLGNHFSYAQSQIFFYQFPTNQTGVPLWGDRNGISS